MKKEDKLRELEAMRDHFITIITDRIKESGGKFLNNVVGGDWDMCDNIKTLDFAIKTLGEIEDNDVDEKPKLINTELDPYGEENWDDDEPKGSIIDSLTKKTSMSDLFGGFINPGYKLGERKRPVEIPIDNAEDTDTNSYFDVDNIVNNLNDRATTHDIQRALVGKVQRIQAKFNCSKIISNGNLISVLQDVAGYTINPVTGIKSKEIDATIPFPMGNLGNLTLYIDAYMRWDDNRILFYVDENAAKEYFVHTLNIRDTQGILI